MFILSEQLTKTSFLALHSIMCFKNFNERIIFPTYILDLLDHMLEAIMYYVAVCTLF
jgi:hypothetical protein